MSNQRRDPKAGKRKSSPSSSPSTSSSDTDEETSNWKRQKTQPKSQTTNTATTTPSDSWTGSSIDSDPNMSGTHSAQNMFSNISSASLVSGSSYRATNVSETGTVASLSTHNQVTSPSMSAATSQVDLTQFVDYLRDRYDSLPPISIDEFNEALTKLHITPDWNNELGRGTYGVAYSGSRPDTRFLDRYSLDEAPREPLAIKQLAEYSDAPRFALMVSDECYWSYNVDHVNLVHTHFKFGPVYDPIDRTVRGCFLVQEFIHGGDLWHYFFDTRAVIDNEKKLYPLFVDTQVVNMAEQVLRGLGWLHRYGVQHCDCHFSNIMLDKHGTLKIIDFGMIKTKEPAVGHQPESESDTESESDSESEEKSPDRISSPNPIPMPTMAVPPVADPYAQYRPQPPAQLDAHMKLLQQQQQQQQQEHAQKASVARPRRSRLSPVTGWLGTPRPALGTLPPFSDSGSAEYAADLKKVAILVGSTTGLFPYRARPTDEELDDIRRDQAIPPLDKSSHSLVKFCLLKTTDSAITVLYHPFLRQDALSLYFFQDRHRPWMGP